MSVSKTRARLRLGLRVVVVSAGLGIGGAAGQGSCQSWHSLEDSWANTLQKHFYSRPPSSSSTLSVLQTCSFRILRNSRQSTCSSNDGSGGGLGSQLQYPSLL